MPRFESDVAKIYVRIIGGFLGWQGQQYGSDPTQFSISQTATQRMARPRQPESYAASAAFLRAAGGHQCGSGSEESSSGVALGAGACPHKL